MMQRYADHSSKRAVRVFLPWIAAFAISSAVAGAINVGMSGASTEFSQPVQHVVAAPTATSHGLLADAQPDHLKDCLAAWGHVAAERPAIYAAGFEQFVASGCLAP
jgi:hypothetical protein